MGSRANINQQIQEFFGESIIKFIEKLNQINVSRIYISSNSYTCYAHNNN